MNEQQSRRGLFKTAAKVAIGLVAFVPAARSLASGTADAHAASPSQITPYEPCGAGSDICTYYDHTDCTINTVCYDDGSYPYIYNQKDWYKNMSCLSFNGKQVFCYWSSKTCPGCQTCNTKPLC